MTKPKTLALDPMRTYISLVIKKGRQFGGHLSLFWTVTVRFPPNRHPSECTNAALHTSFRARTFRPKRKRPQPPGAARLCTATAISKAAFRFGIFGQVWPRPLSCAGTTLLRTEISCGPSFLTLPTNSGRNNAPNKLFLDHGAGTALTAAHSGVKSVNDRAAWREPNAVRIQLA